jgi:hypothetical protein
MLTLPSYKHDRVTIVIAPPSEGEVFLRPLSDVDQVSLSTSDNKSNSSSVFFSGDLLPIFVHNYWISSTYRDFL